MCGHEDGGTLLIERRQHVHDLCAVARVQVARRLVSDNELRATSRSIAVFGLLFLYVFTVQVAIMVYARRVRRRREKLEAIRDSLKAA
jgi:hypothetical protein